PGFYPEYLLALVTKGDEGAPYADNAEPACVAIQTPPFNLVLSLLAAGADAEAVMAALARDLRTDYAALPGVTASKALAPIFAWHWQAVSGQTYQVSVEERIYKLTAVLPVTGVAGVFRRATQDDRTLLIDWMQAFADEELLGEPHDAERVVDNILASPDRAIYLWEDAGRPVSLAAYGSPTPNGIRVGPVYTPPEARGHGYASACVAALSQLLLDSGRRFCFLFTDLANPTSNHIYQAIGYEPVADVDMYTFS
ncbi:MAG TPA: GNAT family N-acetyltransferase, partial [Ktedonobacterales bacterium]|nr:GNAT family N-acetyltransferase [Ktedonobacterales bacterium]